MGTEHYNLKQWESWEVPRRSEVNEVIAGADAAINGAETLAAGKCRMAYGSYSGDNAESRFISLPFTPSVVLLEQRGGLRQQAASEDCLAGMAATDQPLYQIHENSYGLWIAEQGFYVAAKGHYRLNNLGTIYYYVALA